MKRNPRHSVCFPLIGACGRTVTLPVYPMQYPEKFRELFITAYRQERYFAWPYKYKSKQKKYDCTVKSVYIMNKKLVFKFLYGYFQINLNK